MSADAALLRHEASHAAAALWFGNRRIDEVRVDAPTGDVAGQMTSTLQGERGAHDLIIAIIGYLAGGEHPDWPPAWPVAEDELDNVGRVVRRLDLDEAGYRECILIAERLLADEDFQKLVDLISRALSVAPVIDGESVQILARAAGVPTPEPERTSPDVA